LKKILEKRKSEQEDSAEDYGTLKAKWKKKKSPDSRNENITITDQQESRVRIDTSTPIQKMKNRIKIMENGQSASNKWLWQTKTPIKTNSYIDTEF